MKDEFAVLYGQIPVGKAEFVRQGLYFRITCRYRLPSGEVCRLIAKWSGGWESIGIPVPESDGFMLVKKVPVKRFPEGELCLHLIPVGKGTLEDMTETSSEPEKISEDDQYENRCDEEPSVPEEAPARDREQIQEAVPFENLHRLEGAILETVEDRTFVVFDEGVSQVQLEADGAVVGAEDICVDGCGDDLIFETV